MAERTEGSFSYSILDDKNNVWLVKGDSPLSILHFPKLKIYVYASTDEILYKALIEYRLLFDVLKKGEFETVDISDGEMLKIRADGKTERSKFEYSCYFGMNWWDYGTYSYNPKYANNDYIEDLKSIAVHFGYAPDAIDVLVSNGFTPEEIEDYIYCECGGEI